jgi:nitrogenase subunit NifH
LTYPPKTKTTYETNKENIITEEMDDCAQIRDSESELDMITIPIESNGQSSMIPPKDTESINKREDPGSELITYALDSNKATFFIDINKQVHKNDNKLIINIKDITRDERSQENNLENKE